MRDTASREEGAEKGLDKRYTRVYIKAMKHVEGRLANIIGMQGSGMVRMVTTIKAGRGSRDIPVDLEPKLIVRLAYLLEATKDRACETTNSRVADPDEMGYHVGHAVWHLRNPERAVPCIDPARVIDMRSLPSGEDAE